MAKVNVLLLQATQNWDAARATQLQARLCRGMRSQCATIEMLLMCQRTMRGPMVWVPVPSAPYCASVTLAFASAGAAASKK